MHAPLRGFSHDVGGKCFIYLFIRGCSNCKWLLARLRLRLRLAIKLNELKTCNEFVSRCATMTKLQQNENRVGKRNIEKRRKRGKTRCANRLLMSCASHIRKKNTNEFETGWEKCKEKLRKSWAKNNADCARIRKLKTDCWKAATVGNQVEEVLRLAWAGLSGTCHMEKGYVGAMPCWSVWSSSRHFRDAALVLLVCLGLCFD